MNLIKVLSRVNQIEKISFLKILDKYCEESRVKNPKIDKILTESDNVLKKAEDSSIVHLFTLLREDYRKYLEGKIIFSNLQLDVIVEIFVRDGNQLMSKEWFSKLYKKKISSATCAPCYSCCTYETVRYNSYPCQKIQLKNVKIPVLLICFKLFEILFLFSQDILNLSLICVGIPTYICTPSSRQGLSKLGLCA